MKRVLLGAVALAAGLATGQAFAADPVTLQLKWVAQAQFGGYYAAKEKGYYKAAGLDVNLKIGGPTIINEQTVLSKQAEFGVNWFPALLANRDQGNDLVNIAQVYTRSGTTEVTWKKDGINNFRKMRGKKFGVWIYGNEFEQRAAYFDGDPVIATKKGANVLERGSQVHAMAEFEALLDFPPAPKLNVFGRLNPAVASDPEKRGEALFFGKAQCGPCHVPPYYTDNSMHNLRTERFYKPQMINGRMASADGPIKTFVLRGIKDSPPYLHDDRLLTLEDTVEFFNLILGTKLTAEEKQDLVAFLRAL